MLREGKDLTEPHLSEPVVTKNDYGPQTVLSSLSKSPLDPCLWHTHQHTKSCHSTSFAITSIVENHSDFRNNGLCCGKVWPHLCSCATLSVINGCRHLSTGDDFKPRDNQITPWHTLLTRRVVAKQFRNKLLMLMIFYNIWVIFRIKRILVVCS